MNDVPDSHCVSCGAPQPLDRAFCGECGERRVNQDDRKLSAFLARAAFAVSDLDSRLLRTLRTLIFSPGTLTLEHRKGRRKPYLQPVQLFLLINVVYFVLQPFTVFGGYNTKMSSHIERQYYSIWFPIETWMTEKAAQLSLDLDAFEVVFNSQSELLASTLILLIVPLFALAVGALMVRRNALLIDHVVFSLHFIAYYLLILHCVIAFLWYPVVQGLTALLGLFAADADAKWIQNTIGVVTEFGLVAVVVMPYLYIAFKRVYRVSKMRALASAIVGCVALMAASITYRFLLLIVTLRTV